MPVVGINFTSINAYIDEKKSVGNVDVNSTPQIKNITKKEIDVANMKDVLSVEFSFVTKYEPKIGEVEIRGEVLYQTDDAKKILALWKEKKIDTKLTVDVFNVIFRKCITKAIQLTDDLRLPPPLTYPQVKTEAQTPAASEEGGKKTSAS